MQQIIEEAIDFNHQLYIIYKCLPRIVEPYLMVKSVNNIVALIAYQVDGESLSGENGWREFDIVDITGIELLNMYFIPRNMSYPLLSFRIEDIVYGNS